MTARQISLGLLEAACVEFNTQILPQLAPEQRYAGAMLRRALEVLRAEAQAPAAPDAALAQAGFGTAAALATALRKRETVDSSALRQALRAYVAGKLEIANPRFLAATNAAEKAAGP
ncbi:MAG TPA: DUF6285 domain-containing protein [Kiloniellaceae bacterium]|nr:DUF6285 domain-containing protein [Kiloniellaceae bacterium]